MASLLSQDDNITELCSGTEKYTNENTKHECPSRVPEKYSIRKHEHAESDTEQDKTRYTDKGLAKKLGVGENAQPLTPCKELRRPKNMPCSTGNFQHDKSQHQEHHAKSVPNKSQEIIPTVHGQEEHAISAVQLPFSESIQSQIDARRHIQQETEWLQEKIDSKFGYLLVEYDKKFDILRTSLRELPSTKKPLPPDLFTRISNEKKVLCAKMDEYTHHKKEFCNHYIVLMEKLYSMAKSTHEVGPSRNLPQEIQEMDAQFKRECTHFETALPIYARRTDVVDTICSNQVTILVGETGSGKSTQVVQYLYDAGVANNGLIVCTQPRKVAAITLAKHVSKEMHVKLGEELGYRVGMKTVCSPHTRILYMTDHVLLNECISDRSLSKYSCLVIDEAHERSINTDVLLAFIKQCLPTRPDLRVVIMSATIQPELFVNYFKQGTASVATIKVSGRTFPVNVIYDPLNDKRHVCDRENEHVLNAVRVATDIHFNEEPGDILVFFTCAREIEKACKAMQELSLTAEILPLHGKLPPEEQQKVFESGTKQKIIFATNVAETSITIPGVKYVVDTGLAKEMQFDPNKNMDSLQVRMISKSSADQRKGRAGRTSPGKCYRLYTSEQYDLDMSEHSTPEILRIQLAQVVLKLFEFGVPDVLTFNFVEHPDRDALENALETLKFVGAVKDAKLTVVGMKMAALPLNPHLSKVLLDGIEAGVGTEALFTVALSSLSSSVFFRGGTDEMKLASDKKKLQFVHKMGDQMTNLIVYQNWLEQNKHRRNQWCLQNYVNAKSMRIVDEAVKELGHILRQRLHQKISLELWSLDEAAHAHLIPKLFFDAFLNNLSVYLGHESAGYLFSEASGTFVIFPGSSLKQLNSTPKYVLFERTLKTSQQFLTQVMHVEEVWVDEAVKSGRLLQDPAERFKAYMVTPLNIVAVGPCTYNKAMYDHKSEISEKMSSVSSSQPVKLAPTLDYSLSPKQWGVIRVVVRMFSPQSDREKVRTVVIQCTSQVQDDLKKTTKEYGITKKDDNVRVLVGTGGLTKQVVMPYQFRTVLVQGPHSGKWVTEVKYILKSFGTVQNESFEQEHGHYRLFITYETPEQAQRAVVNCRYPDVVVLPSKAVQFTLKVQWQRRERNNFVNICLDSPHHVEIALRYLSSYNNIFVLDEPLDLDELIIRPDRFNPKQIFITSRGGILRHIDEAHLRERIAAMLDGSNIQFRLMMGHRKRYSSSRECESYKQDLAHIISQYANLGEFFIHFPEPKETSINFEAYVKFVNPDIGYKVLNSELTCETIGEKPLSVTASLQSRLIIRRCVFDIIEMNLEKQKQTLLRRFSTGLQIKIWKQNQQNKNTSCIIIRSSDVQIFAIAQNTLNAVAQPHVIECKTPELQQYIISSAYEEQVKEIQVSTCTCIWTDRREMSINIYGTKENQAKANAEIDRGTKALYSGGAVQVKLSLKGSDHPPGVMRYLVSRYGSDLEKLLEIDGVRVITLDARKQVVSLLATSKGQETVKKCIGEFSPPTLMAVEQSEFEVECSTCLTQIETPEELIRLECCGHAYHTLCIEQQLKPNSIVFPVECTAEGCSQGLVLQDFVNVQKKCNFRMQELVSQSVRDYMRKNSSEMKNCPTPDCQMVYITTDTGKPFLCSHCGVATCTKCHKQYHSGISCEMYEAGKKDDELLKKWMQRNSRNRKYCPKCNAPIEKNGGCNHMHVTCTQCRAEICWLCMDTFSSADDCYKHMPYCPRNQL